jgi:hypothetical protein
MVKSDQTRSTITIWLSSLILVGSMAMSYGNQAEYLLSIGVGWGSWILPLMLDLMVLTANVALGVIALVTGERTKIRRIMWAALLASAWTNFAGGHNLKAGLYHASAVLLYLAAEKIVTIVVEAITRARAQAATQVTVTEPTADEAASPDLPEAPVSPAPRIPERTERRHRTGK